MLVNLSSNEVEQISSFDNFIVRMQKSNSPQTYIDPYIQKSVSAQFMEDVRHVMGLPEWMLSIDSRRTKTLHNGACIQMLVHFKGGQAHRIEKDLTILIASGRLSDPSIAIPGYVDQKRKQTLSYRACGVRDPNEKSKSKKNRFFGSGAAGGRPSWQLTIVGLGVAVFVMFG